MEQRDPCRTIRQGLLPQSGLVADSRLAGPRQTLVWMLARQAVPIASFCYVKGLDSEHRTSTRVGARTRRHDAGLRKFAPVGVAKAQGVAELVGYREGTPSTDVRLSSGEPSALVRLNYVLVQIHRYVSGIQDR